MKYNIVSGVSQQFYHSIPSDLDLIQTSPTRDGIFQMLSQIPYDKFPEFILDILVRIEKHTPVDITDGQGDEKQDILTLNPEGKRCLTQCKHTSNYKDHYNGDDLDKMVSACLRKNCQEAIFVTNSDLTPQGKKYITDDEYKRGWPGDVLLCPKIDYWNGYKIWEKIKNDNEIINKWFSGLGQVHSLRSFKFDITIQRLPFENNEEDSELLNNLMSTIKSKKWAKEIHKDFAYEVSFKKDFILNLKRWFQFSGNLDINFVLPNDDINFFHRPLYAFTIEVILSDEKKVYSPNKIKADIVDFLSKEILNDLSDGKWWHITCSQIKSNMFLHDINEPREIVLETASTFVKSLKNSSVSEIDFCNLKSKDYSLKEIEDDDDSIWIHKQSGIQVIQIFDQKINPVEDYNYQVSNFYKIEQFKNYIFQAVSNIDQSLMMRVRKLIPFEWIALEKDKEDFIWGFPKETSQDVIELTRKKIEAIGLEVLRVKEEDKLTMIDGLKVDPTPRFHMHSVLSRISFPVALNKRVFWLSRDIEFKNELTLEKRSSLVAHKYKFEDDFGFKNMGKETQMVFKEHEIKGLLFDIMTFRGKRMMDIAILSKNKISLNIRFKEENIDSSINATNHYVTEFESAVKDLVKQIDVA